MPSVRPLKGRDPHERHRVSTQLELLFDLIAVIAIAAVTAGFHHAISAGHGLQALPNFVFLFLAIWWAWMGFTWFASGFDNDDPLYRLLVMVIMAGFLIFAGGAGRIFETLDFSYGVVGWIVMRIGMAALWLRAARDAPDHAPTARRYAAGIILVQIVWTTLYFLMEPASVGFMIGGAICFLLEWSVPLIAERAGPTPWHRHHITERYGLLTIITLGEAMLSVALGFGALYSEHGGFDSTVTAVSSLAILFALWWIYFLEEDHLSSRDYGRAFLWGYGHVVFFAACALLGAGIAAQTDVATHHAAIGKAEAGWWIGGPLAAALITLWVIRDRFHPHLGGRALALPVMAAAMLAAAQTGESMPAYAVFMAIALVWRAGGFVARRS